MRTWCIHEQSVCPFSKHHLLLFVVPNGNKISGHGEVFETGDVSGVGHCLRVRQNSRDIIKQPPCLVTLMSAKLEHNVAVRVGF